MLEIGTGSGYQEAVLAELAREVLTIEIVPQLAYVVRWTLNDDDPRIAPLLTGNENEGWPQRAPFPRIIVTAAPDAYPPGPLHELAVGGIMVVPVGTLLQEIVIVTQTADGVAEKRTIPV